MSGQIHIRFVRKFDADRFVKALIAHLLELQEREKAEVKRKTEQGHDDESRSGDV